jgi:hypothetical protein
MACLSVSYRVLGHSDNLTVFASGGAERTKRRPQRLVPARRLRNRNLEEPCELARESPLADKTAEWALWLTVVGGW